MSTLTLAPHALDGLALGNEVLVEWVSCAAPTASTRTAGTVVAMSTETLHLLLAAGGIKIINLERITGVTVRGLGAAALTQRRQAAELLELAAEQVRLGEMAAAAAALEAAVRHAPGLGVAA